MDEMLQRLEKTAGASGVFKSIGNYLKNVSGYKLNKLKKENPSMNSQRHTELPIEIHNAKVDRRKALLGTGAVAVAGGAGLGGYKGYSDGVKAVENNLPEQNQLSQEQQIQKAAKELNGMDELLERLEKTAGLGENIWRSFGIDAAKAKRAYNNFDNVDNFSQVAPQEGVESYFQQLQGLKDKMNAENKLRDKARGDLLFPGILAGTIGASAGLSVLDHNLEKKRLEARRQAFLEENEHTASELIDLLEKTANPMAEQEEDDSQAQAPAQPEQAPQPQLSPEELAHLQAILAQQGAQQPVPQPAVSPEQQELQAILAQQGAQQQSVPQEAVPQEVVSPEQQELQAILAEQAAQQQAVPQEVSPEHQELQAILAAQQAEPRTDAVEDHEQILEDQSAESPRQGAGSISNAAAGVDKSAEELLERLEKTAGVGSAIKSFGSKTKNFVNNVRGKDFKANSNQLATLKNPETMKAHMAKGEGPLTYGKQIQDTQKLTNESEKAMNTARKQLAVGTGIAGAGAVAGAALDKDKVASEISGDMNKTAGEKSSNVLQEYNAKAKQAMKDWKKVIGDTSSKEELVEEKTASEESKTTDSGGDVEKEYNSTAALAKKDLKKIIEAPSNLEKTENQEKAANEQEDMLTGLFKEAAAVIMDMHFPEIRQHIDPMHRITFSK